MPAIKKKKQSKAQQKILGALLKRLTLGTVSEANVPKELISYILGNIDAIRKEFIQAVSKEIGKVLTNVRLDEIIDSKLKDYNLKINAEISLEPKKKATTRVSAKTTKKAAVRRKRKKL